MIPYRSMFRGRGSWRFLALLFAAYALAWGLLWLVVG